MSRASTPRLAAIAAIALSLVAAKDDPLRGRVAGTPKSCVPLGWLQGPMVVDEHTIIYREGAGRRLWKTGPRGRCPALRPLTTLIVDVYGGQLCRNDKFRVQEAGTYIPSAYCLFDSFTPYDKPAKPAK